MVAPPDAVAATAIAKKIGLPRRIVTILEGESLLNDATALVALRTAIAAMLVGVEYMNVGLDFLVASVGGVLVGFVVFVVVAKLRKLITDPVLDVAISFVVPFGTYIAAERIHASGVVAVVIAGLLLGHKAPIVQTAQSRIAERMNWRTIAFVLENTVFLLIGAQAPLDPRGRRGQPRCRPRGSSRSAWRRWWARSCSGWRGCSPRVTCWSAPGGIPKTGVKPPWQVHRDPRLGGHARRGHARGRLRDP